MIPMAVTMTPAQAAMMPYRCRFARAITLLSSRAAEILSAFASHSALVVPAPRGATLFLQWASAWRRSSSEKSSLQGSLAILVAVASSTVRGSLLFGTSGYLGWDRVRDERGLMVKWEPFGPYGFVEWLREFGRETRTVLSIFFVFTLYFLAYISPRRDGGTPFSRLLVCSGSGLRGPVGDGGELCRARRLRLPSPRAAPSDGILWPSPQPLTT